MDFSQMGIHALIALDDSRQCKGIQDALLRQEIAERYNRTRDNGGTTLTFAEWKEVFRNCGCNTNDTKRLPRDRSNDS